MTGVNLIPSRLLIQHAAKRRIRHWVAACLLLSGITLVPMAVEGQQQARIHRLKLKVIDIEGRLSAVRGQVGATAQAVLDADAELARAQALMTKRSWSGLLWLVSSCVPDAVWLTSITAPGPQGSQGRRAVGASRTSGRGRGKTVTLTKDAAGVAGPQRIVLAAPTELHVQGFALDHESLYDLMSQLKESDAFSSVMLVRAGMEPVFQGSAVRFVLTCKW